MTYHDKRLIGGSGEINNLMPAKYQWAWKMVMDSIANTWFHHQTPMTRDKPDFDRVLNPVEKETFLNVFATLTTSDIAILRNVAASIMRHITAPEVELYLSTQIAEERVHCYSEDTEILTNNGWKLFKYLTHDDHVFEYQGVECLNTYSKPKHIIRSDYEGPMYHFRGDTVDLLVTPEHRMVYLENGDPNKLRVALAKDYDPTNNPIILNKPLGLDDGVGEVGIVDGVSVVEYSGTIHCVSVDSGMVCVRRLGKQAICGNSVTYQHVVEILCLDEASIYSRYLTIPEIKQKFDYANIMTDKIDRFEDIESLLEGLFFYYMVFEGIWFYNGFSPIYSLGRRNILPGTATQLQYIQRDECLSGDTELLTPNGWVNVKDIDYKVEIAQWSRDGTISYVKPLKLSRHIANERYILTVNDPYTNELILDQCITQSHRIVYYDSSDALCEVKAMDFQDDKNTRMLIGYNLESNQTIPIPVEWCSFRKESCDDFFYGIQVPSSYLLIRRNGSVSVTGNSNHVAFGVKLLRGIFEENQRLSQDKAHAIMVEGIRLEEAYAKRTIGGMLGYNPDTHIEQAKYIANRRLKQLGYDILYPTAENVLPWLDEMVNVNKEKNFFETHVTEYQSAASLDGTWD